MASILYLIRHGETEGSGERRYKGQIDVPLSVDGERQLEITGRALSDVPFAAVYSSELSRAVRSAELLLLSRQIAPQPLAALKERNFGRWEGLTFNECRTRFPEEFDAWVRNPLESSPVGGESTMDVSRRVFPLMDELCARHIDQTFAVVAHGGVNRIILARLLGMPLENIFRIEQDFGCVNIIEIWPEGCAVRLLNGVFYNGNHSYKE